MSAVDDLARTVDNACAEIDRLRAINAELLAACKLAELHFRRNEVSGNFQGDDEHEAWTALGAAIARAVGRS